MRSLVLLGWGLLLLAAGPAAGQPAASPPPEVGRAFEAGNRHYADGDYAEALERYDVALGSGWTSAALHYNVAGAHYRLGQLGAAVQHYEKARRLYPQNERLRHNLSVVRGQLDAPPPARGPFLAYVQERVAAWVPPVGLLAAGLMLFVAGLGWWVQSQSGIDARFGPRGVAAALLGTGATLAALGLLLSVPAGHDRAVALRGPLTLHAAPADDTDSTAAVPEGTVLRLSRQRGAWRRVRSSRGDGGWVRAEALGEI